MHFSTVDVYTILGPYLIVSLTSPRNLPQSLLRQPLKPMITSVTGILDEGSKAVIDNEDQYEVSTPS